MYSKGESCQISYIHMDTQGELMCMAVHCRADRTDWPRSEKESGAGQISLRNVSESGKGVCPDGSCENGLSRCLCFPQVSDIWKEVLHLLSPYTGKV